MALTNEVALLSIVGTKQYCAKMSVEVIEQPKGRSLLVIEVILMFIMGHVIIHLYFYIVLSWYCVNYRVSEIYLPDG